MRCISAYECVIGDARWWDILRLSSSFWFHRSFFGISFGVLLYTAYAIWHLSLSFFYPRVDRVGFFVLGDCHRAVGVGILDKFDSSWSEVSTASVWTESKTFFYLMNAMPSGILYSRIFFNCFTTLMWYFVNYLSTCFWIQLVIVIGFRFSLIFSWIIYRRIFSCF